MTIAKGQSDAGRAGRDADLVAAARAGDVAAFGRLYDRHAGLIRAICHDTTGDLNCAQDLCQETFLRAYRRLGELRAPENFVGWLVGIARFVSREWRRTKFRDRHQYVGLALEQGLSAAAPDVIHVDEFRQLRAALASLPARQRLALHLFYLNDQSADQARAVMNRSRAGFYKLLERSRRQLAKLLGPSMEDPS